MLAPLTRWRGVALVAAVFFCYLIANKARAEVESKISLPPSSGAHSPELPLHTDELSPATKSTPSPPEPPSEPPKKTHTTPHQQLGKPADDKFYWSTIKQEYPVASFLSVPSPAAKSIPRIQHVFPRETKDEKATRVGRLELIKGNFTHAWNGYKEHAWLRDEVMPISGNPHDPFGGWAATLVDSLDTLWMMGMKDEFENAINAIDKIDFSTCALEELNVFETTIRYLGGFIAAYDLSEKKYPALITKATEMGEMLYKAFDTPNRLPIMRWNFKDAISGKKQVAGDSVLVSEPGSLTLEFTRLSQITGDMKYFDAVQRIMAFFEDQQGRTKLPGMWPVIINQKDGNFRDYGAFTIGGMADSLYEYLPKQHMLLGGGSQQYRRLYEYSMTAMKRNIFYRPMTKDDRDLLFAGQLNTDGKTHVDEIETEPQAQHLGCFAGGMVAIGAKIFENDGDLEIGKQLVEGCLWGYEVMPLGMMPEIMHTVPCERGVKCKWDEEKWHKAVNDSYKGPESAEEKIKAHGLGPGVAKVDDTRYILRPEAIESIFILYRITGDETLRERAWNMFNAITTHTTTDIAHAALDDCTVAKPTKADRMESFWMAETLKYFYLIFEEPSVVSLDEYVFNTEAHPLRRPV